MNNGGGYRATINGEGGAGSRPNTERTRTILLVEDNADDVELMLRALKRSGFPHQVVAVRDGVQAIDYLMRRGVYAGRGSDDPLLVLLDLKLPRISGLDVLAQVRSNPALRALPIVMLTSSGHERDIAEAYKLGVNSYIRKPTDFREFVEMVGEITNYWFNTVQLPGNHRPYRN